LPALRNLDSSLLENCQKIEAESVSHPQQGVESGPKSTAFDVPNSSAAHSSQPSERFLRNALLVTFVAKDGNDPVDSFRMGIGWHPARLKACQWNRIRPYMAVPSASCLANRQPITPSGKTKRATRFPPGDRRPIKRGHVMAVDEIFPSFYLCEKGGESYTLDF
jgi:hypothetical protein